MSHFPRALRHRPIPALALGAAGSLVAALAFVSLGAPAHSETVPGSQETRPFEPGEDEAGPDIAAPKSHSPSRVPAKNVPTVAGLPVTGASGVNTRIDGLTMKDQRLSNGGNSFSLEPPDQALCVGNGSVIEGINNVFSVYDAATGAKTSGTQSYAPFFTGQNEVTRNPDGTIASFGPFMSDPKCYYDPATQRFFMTELQLGTDPATGDFTGDSFTDIAVSKTSTPTTNSSRLVPVPAQRAQRRHAGDAAPHRVPVPGRPAADRRRPLRLLRHHQRVPDRRRRVQRRPDLRLRQGGARDRHHEGPADRGRRHAAGRGHGVQRAAGDLAIGRSVVDAATAPSSRCRRCEFTGGFDNRIATWALTNTASLATATPRRTPLAHRDQVRGVRRAAPPRSRRPGPSRWARR